MGHMELHACVHNSSELNATDALEEKELDHAALAIQLVYLYSYFIVCALYTAIDHP